MKNTHIFLLITGIVFIALSCGKNDASENKNDHGNIAINFEHFADGSKLIFDEMNYTNAAGNQYEVTEIQWFISDVTLNKSDGSRQLINNEKFAHYIDTNIPETNTWNVKDEIKAGDYSSITMTFGIKGDKNKPFMFTDPPESDMLWPKNLGGDKGGYHYMKLNGFWINKNNQREPFNFHLGVGQEKDADNNITGFIQNWIEIELPTSSFSLQANETKVITIRMNVEKWWKAPNVYDHNKIGGKIMQNQEAMRMGVENGTRVFSIGQITSSIEKQ